MGVFSDYISSPKRRESIYAVVRNSFSAGTTEIHIEQICSALQLDYQKVVKDLEYVIPLAKQYKYDLLNKAYIDRNRKMLIITPQGDNSITGQLKNAVDGVSAALLGKSFFGKGNNTTVNRATQNNQPIINAPTQCCNCGAPIDGRMTECGYCGSPLK